MNAINSLIKELTKSADKWSENNMPELTKLCRGAAITILKLQNDVELLREMRHQTLLETQGVKANNVKLQYENKKLREFAKMMLLVCKNQGIVGGVFTYPDRNNNINEYVDFECCARELGVETK